MTQDEIFLSHEFMYAADKQRQVCVRSDFTIRKKSLAPKKKTNEKTGITSKTAIKNFYFHLYENVFIYINTCT